MRAVSQLAARVFARVRDNLDDADPPSSSTARSTIASTRSSPHGHTMPLIPDAVDRIAAQDWWSASLLKPSVLKPTLTTMDLPLILKKLGQLTPSNQARLQQTLVLIFS